MKIKTTHSSPTANDVKIFSQIAPKTSESEIPVGARYSATALTWGDVRPVRFGMIRVRDVAAGVSDLLSAQRLNSAPHAIGGIQERGDPGAMPPGERLASA